MSDEFSEKVRAAVGDLSDMEFFHNSVVVAKFIRTHVSKNILAASSTQTEDKWQGKVGLVLAVGPSAFVDEPGFNFHGLSVKPGDWVIYRNTDGWDFDYTADGTSEKIHMRLLEDAHIKGRVTRPDLIW
jgi:co-chaperonin GroES (HSP10)